jgi:hypothetical protein
MHTFEEIGYRWLQQCNWCWHQHGDKTLQSAACTIFELSTIHYRYVCSFWRHSNYIYVVWYPYSRFITYHKGPPLDHIESRYNSAHIFITLSLIPHSIACCSQIQTIIIIIHIFNDLGSDLLCFPQSVQYIFFIGLPALIFPFRILYCDFFIIIFSFFPLFFCLQLKLCL